DLARAAGRRRDRFERLLQRGRARVVRVVDEGDTAGEAQQLAPPGRRRYGRGALDDGGQRNAHLASHGGGREQIQEVAGPEERRLDRGLRLRGVEVGRHCC